MSRISCLAISRNGHDCGKVFAVCKEEETFVYLADGKGRTLSHPKKKNKKHVQLIRRFSAELVLAVYNVRQDSDIVHLLRMYHKEEAERLRKETVDCVTQENV